MDSTTIGIAANLVMLVIVAVTAFAALRKMHHRGGRGRRDRRRYDAGRGTPTPMKAN